MESRAPQEAEVPRSVMTRYPSGRCNVWGAAEGLLQILADLHVGDVILLVHSIARGGLIPALAEVTVKPPVLMPYTSDWLWGEARYPVVFFFETERLDLTWTKFADYLQFANNYHPPAHVHSIAPERLDRLGGVAAFVRMIREQHGVRG